MATQSSSGHEEPNGSIVGSRYDVQTYLLDKSNIHDIIMKQFLYYDTYNVEGLEKEIYAPQCTIDYTAMFGGEPLQTTNKEWAEEAINIIRTLDPSQHYHSGILVQLPQPGTLNNSRPDICNAITNSGAHMFRKAAEGGPSTHNGGRQTYELIRMPDLEERGENPWRIRRQKIVPIWMEGNHRVTDLMKGSKIFSN